MNKRHLHHILKQLRVIKPWYFIIALLVVGLVMAFSLRANNAKAVELRDTVLAVDEQNGDVESALRDLREHVYSHMNSSLAVQGGAYPPIQLKYRYERLAASETARVTQANAQLYTEAQGFCESTIPVGRSLNRINCIQDYITQRGGATEQAIPDALYKFDFVSPRWSPDLAGWSIVLFAVLLLLFIARTATVLWIKHFLNN